MRRTYSEILYVSIIVIPRSLYNLVLVLVMQKNTEHSFRVRKVKQIWERLVLNKFFIIIRLIMVILTFPLCYGPEFDFSSEPKSKMSLKSVFIKHLLINVNQILRVKVWRTQKTKCAFSACQRCRLCVLMKLSINIIVQRMGALIFNCRL